MRNKSFSDLSEEVLFLLTSLKHYPGQHDQSTHGNRYRTHPTNPGIRLLSHRGGGPKGHNTDSESPLGPEKPVVKDNRVSTEDVIKNGIRNENIVAGDFLDKATKQVFSGDSSYNETFKFQAGEKKFFAKTVNAKTASKDGKYPALSKKEILNNELRSSAMLDAMDLEDMSSPAGYTVHDGKTYLLQNWQQNAFTGFSSEGRQAIANLSDENISKLLTAEYLIGDSDRHGGNVMVADGNVKEIDFGFAQIIDTKMETQKSFVYQQSGAANRPVSKKEVTAILNKKSSILAAADKYPTKKSSDLIRKRFDLLEKAVNSTENPKWSDIFAYVNNSR